ncbi:Ig-like domain-containing protein, partial [Vibrio parahaemolyticus]
TVAPAAATGKVAFTQNGTAIGEAQVTNGVATWSATGLTADTEYTFGAQYLGDSAHLTSTATAVTVRTAAAPVVVDTAETGVTVSVPAASTAP